MEQFSVHHGLNPDLIQLKNLKNGAILYDPMMFSSEMLNYVTRCPQILHQEHDVAQFQSHPNSSNLDFSAKDHGDPHNYSTWKSCDRNIANYSNSSTSIHENNLSPMFDREGVSGSLKVSTMSPTSFCVKPNCYGSYQDVQLLLSNTSGGPSIRQNNLRNLGEMQCSSQLYQNTIQEVGTNAAIGTQGLDIDSFAQPYIREIGRGSSVYAHQNIKVMGGGSWPNAQPNITEMGRDSWANSVKESSELLSTYGDHKSNPISVYNAASTWISRPVEADYQRNNEGLVNKSVRDQSLSLSLSSAPTSEMHQGCQFGERDDSESLQSRAGVLSAPQEFKSLNFDYLLPSIGSKVLGNTHQDITGTSNLTRCNVGPFGPFTGYATILKSSKYLKPALQLLDEFCSVMGKKHMETFEVCSEKMSNEIRVSFGDLDAAESLVRTECGDAGASTSTFYNSDDISREIGVRSSAGESYRPEYHQKKAKLLYMQEELCRRYKQYHQQMQMVVSSFESVAGLGGATPYIWLALKTISRHFQCLKNAISDQLRHIGKVLGEDLSSPKAVTNCHTKGDTSTTRVKLMKCDSGNTAFFEPQQPVWRPQRGLPERAVAVLRSWLFDHFLHPYPTDGDKHMLAAQTGLTRNQVSNWFINARVRVWKPMVEEIHTLETKGSGERSSQADGMPASENASQPNVLCDIDSSRSMRDGPNTELWNDQDKRSRVECHVPASVDDSLVSFVPCQRGGLEIGGHGGAVSLTLGLRQNSESVQQGHDQIRQHFGSQMIYDFVG